MSTFLDVKGLSVHYLTTDRWVLNNMELTHLSGQVTALVGPSGCGKSTLIRTSCGLIPHTLPAEYRGSISICTPERIEIADAGVSDLATRIAYVGQNPDAAVLTNSVFKEVCFGMQNLCFSPEEIPHKAEQALRRVGLWQWRHDNPWNLSGGNRQRLSLAAALAMEPQLLVLDEPTSTVDDQGKAIFYQHLCELKETGLGILVIDHDIDPILNLLDHVVALDADGGILARGSVREVFVEHKAQLEAAGIWLPRSLRSASYAQRPQIEDFCRADGPTLWERHEDQWTQTRSTTRHGRLVDLKQLRVPHRSPAIDLCVDGGEVVALVGTNGSGKSSFLSALAGILDFDAAHARIDGNTLKRGKHLCGYVFQNPEHQFITSTVQDELRFGNVPDETVAHLLEQFRLEPLKEQHPLTLSGGQARRLSVATMMGQDHELVLLDEPTYGQDWHNTQELMEFILRLKEQGKTIIFATHDLELAERYATHILAMPLNRQERTPPPAPTENTAPLARLNPFSLFAATLIVLVWVGMNHYPALNASVIVITNLLMLLSGVGWKRIAATIGGLWMGVGVFTIATSTLVMDQRAANDGLWYSAFDQASMLMAFVSLILVSGIATNPEKIIRNAVHTLHMPYRVGVAGVSAVSFLHRFRRDFAQLRVSRALRGAGKKWGLLAPVYRWTSSVVPLMIMAVKHSERVALSMDARGLGAFAERSELTDSPWRYYDTLIVLCSWTLTITLWVLFPTPAATIYS